MKKNLLLTLFALFFALASYAVVGPIIGTTSVCVGSTRTLSDTTAGGIWFSSNTAVASISSASGVVTGVAAGTTTITYYKSGSGFSTATFFVNPLPAAISGPASVCVGSSVVLTDVTSGGVWSSGASAIATISSTSGVLTGVSAGTTVATYALTTGCMVARIETVNPIPAPISGSTTVSVGGTITLTDASSGGFWLSGNTAVATVSTGGVVTGVSSGVVNIDYTLTTGCLTITTITVGTGSISPITGTTSVCVGSTRTLADATTGGTWSSSSTAVASVNASSGVVTGVAAGTVIITYTVSSSIVTTVFTVNPVPATISGPLTVGVGGTITLTDATGGGTWTSGSTSVATINSATGVATGVSAGISGIYYVLPTGCAAFRSLTVTTGSIAPITGTANVCLGSTSALADTTSGGTWSSSNSSIASINATTGVVTGIAAGTVTITYTVGAAYVMLTFTVKPIPAPISGLSTVAVGSVITLSDATGGGVWSSGNTAIATTTSIGVVRGVSAGVVNIYYSLTTGCGVYKTITVTGGSSILPITGTASVCVGSTRTLTDSTTGGSWSSSNTAVATVSATSGVVTGVAAGTVTITYTVGTSFVTTLFTVYPVPAAIGGSSTLCAGSSITLTDATSGGYWLSGNTSIAVVGTSSGVVTGISAGVVNIYYSTGVCGASKTITVTGPGAITGSSVVCIGSVITLADSTTGGTWSSSNTSVASVSATGVVTGIAAGVVTISYSSGGCTATKTITVSAPPAAITGSSSVCAGSSISLADVTPGGTWASGNTTIATVSSTGAVGGVSAGVVNIYYIAGGCGASKTITVNPTPAHISGSSAICIGSSVTLTDSTSGGTWSSSNTSVASVSATGVVTGVSAGVANIYYVIGGCGAYKSVTVNPAPSAITGSSSVCAGSSITLADAVTGGTWSSSNTSVATVNTAGVVTGVAAGVANIYYVVGGCGAYKSITVNATPAAITGSHTVVAGSATTLSDATSGGVWSSGTTTIASVGATSGVVTGITAGATNISYTIGSCSALYSFTVTSISIAPIAGTASACAGSTRTLTDATPGGTWSSSNTSVASASAATGIIYGITPGTATITYAIGSTFVTTVFTVYAAPAPITGSSSVCVGSSIALADASSGGTWSSSGSGIASVNATGLVDGISAGVVNIYYVVGTCGAYKSVTVNPAPSLVASATSSCGGGYYMLASGASAYSWAPSTGLTCTTCSAVFTVPASTRTYTVTGTTSAGCSASTTVLLDCNRISGHIYYSGTMSTDSLKVWLVRFNPSDSSITALDSTMTCMASGVPYYKFMDKAAGNYLVKAKLTRSIPGTSGYMPTYGLATTHWYAAASIAHTSGADTQNINMVYGTVPSGPGFIGGYVYAGAGRGTSGDVPAAGMMIILKDVSDNTLTYTYTDATGAYSFSNLAYGNYIVYPEEYVYNTIQSSVISVTTGSESVNGINFKQYRDSRVIMPATVSSVANTTTDNKLTVFPNPTNGNINIQWENQATGGAMVVVTDMVGREVFRINMEISSAAGQQQVDLSSLNNGIYLISIKSPGLNYSNKLFIEK